MPWWGGRHIAQYRAVGWESCINDVTRDHRKHPLAPRILSWLTFCHVISFCWCCQPVPCLTWDLQIELNRFWLGGQGLASSDLDLNPGLSNQTHGLLFHTQPFLILDQSVEHGDPGNKTFNVSIRGH